MLKHTFCIAEQQVPLTAANHRDIARMLHTAYSNVASILASSVQFESFPERCVPRCLKQAHVVPRDPIHGTVNILGCIDLKIFDYQSLLLRASCYTDVFATPITVWHVVQCTALNGCKFMRLRQRDTWWHKQSAKGCHGGTPHQHLQAQPDATV